MWIWKQENEYSLAELLDHPVLGLAMTGDGIDRRSVELLLETEIVDRRPAPAWLDAPFAV